MSHFHPRLITTTQHATVKCSLVSGEIREINCCFIWLGESVRTLSIGGTLLRAAAIQLTVNKIILKDLCTILLVVLQSS